MKLMNWGNIEVVVEPDIELISDASHLEDMAAISTKTTIQRKPAKEVSNELKKKLVINTAKAGHLTVFMNDNIIFSLYGLSRQATTTIHYLLEHYNTSQSSDRYNYLGEKSEGTRKPRVSLPPQMTKHEDILKPYFLEMWENYQEMLKILQDYIYGKIKNSPNPKYNVNDEKLRKIAKKTATQYARIVFPAASSSSMIFSLNIIELARLYIISKKIDFGDEFSSLVDAMYSKVKPYVPNFNEIVEKELKNIMSFDILENKINPLEDYKKEFSKMAENVIVNPMSEKELLSRLDTAFFSIHGRHLNISELVDEIIKFYSTSFGLQNVSPTLKSLESIHFTFAEEMTQYEFEQSVRHRKVRHFTNLFLPAMSEEPDFVIPKLISGIPTAVNLLNKSMKRAWEVRKELLERGEKLSNILSVLPRGIKYRVVKTSDLKNYLHESLLRLCMNAQQEINYHKYMEMKKLNELYPSLKGIFAPRCVYRRILGLTPYCPEMSENGIGRWCGYPMWDNWEKMSEKLKEREF